MNFILLANVLEYKMKVLVIISYERFGHQLNTQKKDFCISIIVYSHGDISSVYHLNLLKYSCYTFIIHYGIEKHIMTVLTK